MRLKSSIVLLGAIASLAACKSAGHRSAAVKDEEDPAAAAVEEAPPEGGDETEAGATGTEIAGNLTLENFATGSKSAGKRVFITTRAGKKSQIRSPGENPFQQEESRKLVAAGKPVRCVGNFAEDIFVYLSCTPLAVIEGTVSSAEANQGSKSEAKLVFVTTDAGKRINIRSSTEKNPFEPEESRKLVASFKRVRCFGRAPNSTLFIYESCVSADK